MACSNSPPLMHRIGAVLSATARQRRRGAVLLPFSQHYARSKQIPTLPSSSQLALSEITQPFGQDGRPLNTGQQQQPAATGRVSYLRADTPLGITTEQLHTCAISDEHQRVSASIYDPCRS
ncbi:unnamed protein product [Pleuronectes platessa]|uniref:Uncharacterized protein n=1 Tax=Pleuronectes platessa TaxID=8262 RepID=A0A9N7VGF5_PLEPL|nr:unnamed protein product [Pleuronectes platessa]